MLTSTFFPDFLFSPYAFYYFLYINSWLLLFVFFSFVLLYIGNFSFHFISISFFLDLLPRTSFFYFCFHLLHRQDTLLLQFFTFFTSSFIFLDYTFLTFCYFFLIWYYIPAADAAAVQLVWFFFCLSIPTAGTAVGMYSTFFFLPSGRTGRWDGMWLRVPTLWPALQRL